MDTMNTRTTSEFLVLFTEYVKAIEAYHAEGPIQHAQRCWQSFAGEVFYVHPDLGNVHPANNAQYGPWAGRWIRSCIENLQQDGTWWPAAPAEASRTGCPGLLITPLA